MADNYSPSLPRRNRKMDDPKMIGPWQVGRTIGKGSSGRVKIARHSRTGQYAAVKIVSKTSLVNSRMSFCADFAEQADRILLNIEREIVIMKLIDHPNIMRLLDVFETSSDLYLILEYVEGGELFQHLCDNGKLPVAEAAGYFQQIISAMDYCHRFNIAHRDLKPENLLLDCHKNIKVADFGMAAWQGCKGNGLLETSCGSPHYAAPEVIMGQAYNGSSSDIWSCGVILFALLAGRLPFDDEDMNVLLEKVKIAKFLMPADVDPHGKDLIQKMLEKDIQKRITIPEIMQHPFFTSHPQKNLVYQAPSLDDIAKPVTNASDIDADIFANLRTLWHGTSDKSIIERLTNDKPTWEKRVYQLLVQYRSRRLENYEGDNETRRRAKRRSIRTPVSPLLPLKGINRPSARSPNVAEFPQDRPDPPTPRRAAHRFKRSSLDATGFETPDFNLSSPPPDQLSSPISPMSPTSPIWDALNLPPLDVPDVQDANVQQFFRQIVEHLSALQPRTPSTSGTPRETEYQHEGPKARKIVLTGNTTAPPPTPANLDHRFDGFMDELTGDYRSGSETEKEEDRKTLRLVRPLGLGFTNAINTTKPLSIGTKQHRPSPLDLTGISNKENTPNPQPGMGELGGGGASLTGKKSSLRRADDGGKRRAAALCDPTFPLLASATPKRAWISNLFKFNPAIFHLLSIHDAHTTREECRRLLTSIGVRVILTQAEGLGVLRCKLNEIKDPAGVMAVAKAVSFRVEMHSASQTQSIGGYVVALTLVQEKGALSSFKSIFNRLRRDWELDAARTPVLPSPALTSGGRFADMIDHV